MFLDNIHICNVSCLFLINCSFRVILTTMKFVLYPFALVMCMQERNGIYLTMVLCEESCLATLHYVPIIRLLTTAPAGWCQVLYASGQLQSTPPFSL